MRTRVLSRAAPSALMLVALLAAGPAAAQAPAPPPPPAPQRPAPPAARPPAPPPSEAARTVAGTAWEFSNADRDRRCTVGFKTDAAGSLGMKIDFDKACAGVFPFLRDAAAWTLGDNDFLRFLDARGKPMLEFSEVEQGLWEAPKPGEGILFLQTAASVKPPAPSQAEMAGDWTLRRGGRVLCPVTLASTPAGEGFALRLGPDCDVAVTRFAPTAWTMDRDELVLTGAGNRTWRFEETDPKTWQRVPETRDPLLMVKR